MILSKPQAEAVYSAMCAVGKFGGDASFVFTEGHKTTSVGRVRPSVPNVKQHPTLLEVFVFNRGSGRVEEHEFHIDQAAFATAYGLNSDEPQSAVAAAAGGLTQTAIER